MFGLDLSNNLKQIALLITLSQRKPVHYAAWCMGCLWGVLVLFIVSQPKVWSKNSTVFSENRRKVIEPDSSNLIKPISFNHFTKKIYRVSTKTSGQWIHSDFLEPMFSPSPRDTRGKSGLLVILLDPPSLVLSYHWHVYYINQSSYNRLQWTYIWGVS
jgi:hypothetical protein